MAVDYNQLWRDPKWRGRMSGDLAGGTDAQKALSGMQSALNYQASEGGNVYPWRDTSTEQGMLDDLHAAMAYEQISCGLNFKRYWIMRLVGAVLPMMLPICVIPQHKVLIPVGF